MPINLHYGDTPDDTSIQSGAQSLIQNNIERQQLGLEAQRIANRATLKQQELNLRAAKAADRSNRAWYQLYAQQYGQGGDGENPAIAAQNNRAELNWQQDNADQADQQLAQIQASMAQTQLTPQGQALYNDWSTKYRAVQKQRSNLRPSQYSQLAGKLNDEFQGLNLGAHVIPKVTPQQQFQQDAIPIPGAEGSSSRSGTTRE